MSLFHHQLAFKPIDPNDDGLADDIAAERSEPDAIQLADQLDGTLANKWEEILTDARHDPEFVFVENEE